MKFNFAIIILFVGSCNLISQPNEIRIENKSTEKIDSIILNVNNLRLKIENVGIDTFLIKPYRANMVVTNHDVVIGYKIYFENSLPNEGHKFLNDLGYLPNTINLIVTDSLNINLVFPKAY